MRLSLVSNLLGNEILSKNVITQNGKLVLKSGIRLNQENIIKLKQLKIFFVYVEDNALDDIHEDVKLNMLKQSTLENMPHIFNNFINGDSESIQNSLNSVYSLIDHVVKNKSININLYEIKNYDNPTYIHSVNTCIMSIFLGIGMKYDSTKLESLALSALLHDIGKTRIPTSIINKKNILTKKEYEIIKLHPFYSKEILSKISDIPASIIDGAAQHHEKFNGTGYPFKIKGKDISEFARIISICDVFTAVSANRSYRNRFNPNEAYELILSSSGTSFDPDIVDLFKQTFYVFPLGCCLKLSNGLDGYVVKQNPSFPDRPIVRVIYDKKKKKIAPYEIDLLAHTNITINSVE